MTKLVLTRVGQTALYVESGSVPAGTGFAAYWLSSPPAQPLAAITPRTAWDEPAYRGWFVFLLAAPSDPAAFAAALQQGGVLPAAPAWTSFAWVRWDDARGVVTGVSLLQVKPDGERTAAAADAAYTFGRYGFPVKADSPVVAERDGSGEPQAFLVAYPPLAGFPTPNARNPSLALFGPARFCLVNAQALVADFGDALRTGYDAAFRYTALYAQSRLACFRYPFVDTPAGGSYHLLLRVEWDPLGALPPARTQLLFAGAAYLLGPASITPALEGAVIPSFFRTLYDEPIDLRPLRAPETDDPGRLVFDVWDDDGTRAYYLTPAGDFELGCSPNLPVGPGRRRKLLPGLSGLESIDYRQRLPGARGDRVRFRPYQPAYAPVFPLVKSGTRPSTPRLSPQGALLDPTWTTSYLSVYAAPHEPQEPPYYQSQADGAPLFHQQQPEDDVLGFFDNQTALLIDVAASPGLPAVPYRGVTPHEVLDRRVYADFEAQILSPSRAAAIGASPGVAAARALARSAGVSVTTTPQGFLAEIDGTAWKKVLVARNATERGVVSELAFHDLGDELRDALQSNELFLVATQAGPLGSFDNTITIADWPFTIAVGGSDGRGGYTNVLLFKFGQGSLRQRAADIAAWTNPGAFNADPSLVSSWLLAYFAETEQLARDNARYLPFLRLIDDPGWNGVLALRVNVQLQDFPAQIKGLLGGIDLARFHGHHIGLNVNLVTTAGGLKMAERNSLFGLISYVAKNEAAPAAPAATFEARRRLALASAVAAPGQYAFRVLSLQVVFLNSEISDFASKITLTITRWFGDSVELQGSQEDPLLRNSIVLYGSYEKHDGVSFYTFQGDGRFRFVAQSKALGYVEIVQAQFHTLSDASSHAAAAVAPEEIRSAFTLWGYLNFLVLPNLDTLSFGNAIDDLSGATRGLYCSGIGVRMAFLLDPGDPAGQPEPLFSFDATQMGFDLTLSHARPASLFTKFPFSVRKVESSDGDRKPSDAGYLPVLSRDLKTVPLQSEWYGLYFGLDLGSMGALAESAGFAAGILAAWSPSPNRASASLLMQIPGTGSGKTQLSLESVLKLGIGRIELVEQEPGSGYYLLKLANIGLFFLGKRLPPSGSTDITLFANDGAAGQGNLAWYGSYFDPKA